MTTPQPTFPPLASQYYICSDTYGNYLEPAQPGNYDQAFLEAVEKGFEDAVLHDTGHMVQLRSNNQLAFLVAHWLPAGAQVSEEERAQFLKEHGLELKLFQGYFEDDDRSKDRLLATVQLDQVEQFPLASGLFAALLRLGEPSSPGAAAACRAVQD